MNLIIAVDRSCNITHTGLFRTINKHCRIITFIANSHDIIKIPGGRIITFYISIIWVNKYLKPIITATCGCLPQTKTINRNTIPMPDNFSISVIYIRLNPRLQCEPCGKCPVCRMRNTNLIIIGRNHINPISHLAGSLICGYVGEIGVIASPTGI